MSELFLCAQAARSVQLPLFLFLTNITDVITGAVCESIVRLSAFLHVSTSASPIDAAQTKVARARPESALVCVGSADGFLTMLKLSVTPTEVSIQHLWVSQPLQLGLFEYRPFVVVHWCVVLVLIAESERALIQPTNRLA